MKQGSEIVLIASESRFDKELIDERAQDLLAD